MSASVQAKACPVRAGLQAHAGPVLGSPAVTCGLISAYPPHAPTHWHCCCCCRCLASGRVSEGHAVRASSLPGLPAR